MKDGETADKALMQNYNYDLVLFELVLLDLGLPRAGGLDVFPTMRARKDRNPVRLAAARDSIA